MKKFIFVFAMMLCFVASMKAQTYVGETPSNCELEGLIPGCFTSSGHPYVLYYNYDNDNLSLYQSDFVTHYQDIDIDDINPKYFEFVDLDGLVGMELYFTQNLFNDDDFLEFFELEKEYITYYDTNYWYDPYEDTTYMEVYEWTESITKAINVKSTNGNTIWSYTFEEDEVCHLGGVFKMDNNYYLLLERGNEDGYTVRIYLIKQNQGLIKVETPLPMKAFPTMPSRDQQITVELGEGTNAHEITVVNSLGQEVKRIPLEKGQSRITIPARDLGRGLNVLNARGDNKQGSCKIIVK